MAHHLLAELLKKGFIYFILSLLPIGFLDAQQTNRRIESNRGELTQFAKQKSSDWLNEKRKADSLASILNIPISYTDDGNRVIILQRLGLNNKPVYYATDNVSAAATISVDKVWTTENDYPLLTGEGIEINLWDGGTVLSTHQEFQNVQGSRIVMRDLDLALSNHSTHIAGTMIATGVNSAARGMAGKATIKGWDLNDDIAEMASAASDGIVLSNHSYGPLCGWYYNTSNESWYWYGDPDISSTEDYEFGFYNQVSADLDYIAQNAPNYLIVKSTGNDRNDVPTSSFLHYVWDENWVLVNVEREPDGGTDGFDCLSPMAVAKNILTVGAVDDAKVMTAFSAFGPTDDGRIKPDVVANGYDVYSSVSTTISSYGVYNGTSMATASATGSVALLDQLQNNVLPGVSLLSSTIKGILIHTAIDAGNSGPDFSFGWGILNIKEAADLMYNNANNQGKYIYEKDLADGEVISIPVKTTSAAPFLKATLCWTDPAGLPSSPSLNLRTKKLVNDLDVKIENSTTLQTYLPWMLNVENPAALATRGINHVDNVEQVYLVNPGNNNFNVKISCTGSLSGGSQKFSLIISGVETYSDIFPPQNLSYSIDESSIHLNWNPPDSGTPNSYKIYRNGTSLAETTDTTYTDQSIILDNVYEYYVTAVYEINSEKIESLGTNQITVFPQTLRSLPFTVDFETQPTEVLIKNNEIGWQWGNSESLNCYYLNFSTNTTKFIGIDSYSAGEAVHVSDIAVTAPLRLANYSDIVLSFDYLLKTGIYDAIDEMHVVYKLQEEAEWHELYNLESSFNWKYKSIELPSEMCKNGTQIGFYYDDFYQWGMGAGLDNIEVTGTLNIQEDISLETIGSPVASICYQTIPSNLTISIKNTGNITIPSGQNIQVTSTCNAIQKTNTYTLLQNLSPGGNVIINFPNMIDYLPVGVHTLLVDVLWQNDQNPSNNIKTKNITINALPTITFVNPPGKLCISETPVAITANPVGGVFSGPSMVGNIFNPSVAGIGTHNITYTYQDANSCANSATITVEVVPLPIVSFTGLSPQYCMNNPPLLLVGNPSGGYFVGDGIVNSYFDPGIAGVGTHVIKYTYTNENGCSNTTEQQTNVVAPAPITIVGLEEMYCQNEDPIELTGLPDGGIFKIDGKVTDYLIPPQAAIGDVNITYTYLDENTCSSTASKSVKILALPQVHIDGLDDLYCLIDSNITLNGLPSGGVFIGNSIEGNIFNPILAGIGEHEISYTFEDAYGCSNSDTIKTEVMPLPTVSFSGLSTQYCANGDPSLLVGSPPNGIFSGTGIIGNYFDPEIAGVGTHQIEYLYIDNIGCSNVSQQETNVLTPTPLSFVGLEDAYCQNEDPVELSALPDGGSFFLNGNKVTYLEPTQQVTGIAEITYVYLDENSCTSTSSKLVNILALPQVGIDGLEDMYCLVDLDITLSGSPSGGSFTLEGEQIVSFNPVELGDGNYDLFYAYQDEYGCAGSTNELFTVNSNPELSISNLKPTYCPYEPSVELSATPTGGYFKVDGILDQILNPSKLAPGNHTVSYFYDLNGCESTTTTATWITDVTPVSILGLQPEYCPEDSLAAIVGQPDGGSFAVEPVFNESPFGRSYDVYYSYTDVSKCTYVDSGRFTILPEPELSLPSNLTMTLLDTATFVMEQADQYYVWPNDSTSTGIQFIGASMPIGKNIIPLIVENIFGCRIDYDLELYVYGTTEIIDASIQDNAVLFPNPTHNVLSILLNKPSNLEEKWIIIVHDLSGKKLPDLKINQVQENEFILDVGNLPDGVYLIFMTNDSLSYNSKFVVKH